MPRQTHAIYPYKAGSKSVKALCEVLECKAIRLKNSKFKPKGKVVFNWGAGDVPKNILLGAAKVLNAPDSVRRAANKLDAFNAFREGRVTIPEFGTSREWAEDFLNINPGTALMIRTVLTGHSGAGIIYCDRKDQLVAAPLYTAYIKKAAEYRVHVNRLNNSLFIQRKARVKDVADDAVNWKVRNLKGGFIYANDPENVGEVPDEVIAEARRALAAVKLDYGAVDIIWNKKWNKAYVLEINTAPGLTGKTLEYYSALLRGQL